MWCPRHASAGRRDNPALMSPPLVAALLVTVAAGAFGCGVLVGRRRAPEPAPPPPPAAEEPASIAGIVRRTGAELTQIAVQTGVDLGSRFVRDSLGSLSAWAVRERPDLRRVTAADGTVTLMFTDIEGSTELNERLGDDGWLALLSEHDRVVRRCVRQGRGQVIKTLGDSFMVAFADAAQGVESAVGVQRDVGELEAPLGAAIRVRIGIHRGPAIARGRDLFGINVATASRVAAHARGGEILVTEDVAECLDGDDRLGRPRTVRLKGISGAPRVVPVRWSEESG